MKRLRILFLVISLVLVYLVWLQYFWIIQAGKRVEHEYRLKADGAIRRAIERVEQRYYCANIFLEEEMRYGDQIYLIKKPEEGMRNDTLNRFRWRFFSSDSLYQYKNIWFGSPARLMVHLQIMFYKDSLGSQPAGNATIDSLAAENFRHPLEYPERFRETLTAILGEELQLAGISNEFGWKLFETGKTSDREEFVEYKSDSMQGRGSQLEITNRIFHNNFFVESYRLSVFLYNIGKYQTPELIKGITATIAILFLLCLGLVLFYKIWCQRIRVESMQTDFISNITHEFNTPVSNLKLALESLRKSLASENSVSDQAAEKKERLLSIAEEESLRIANNTEILLQAGMLNKTLYPQQLEPVALTAFLEAINNKFKLHEPPAPEEITLHSDAYCDTVAIDSRHFTNVIHNIYENAIKYSTRPVKIDVFLRNEANWLVVEILDNGQGIEKRHIPHIFNKFYRGTKGNIHDVKGFGLGLYYSKQIIENSGGKIEVMSKYGYGSKFIIFLPLYN